MRTAAVSGAAECVHMAGGFNSCIASEGVGWFPAAWLFGLCHHSLQFHRYSWHPFPHSLCKRRRHRTNYFINWCILLADRIPMARSSAWCPSFFWVVTGRAAHRPWGWAPALQIPTLLGLMGVNLNPQSCEYSRWQSKQKPSWATSDNVQIPRPSCKLSHNNLRVNTQPRFQGVTSADGPGNEVACKMASAARCMRSLVRSKAFINVSSCHRDVFSSLVL